MKKIYIIRHAQSHSNAGGKAMPNAEIPLTELGQAQAKEVANWMMESTQGNIDNIYVSKFIRTQLTAQPLETLVGKTAQIIEGLQEFDYLAFENIDGLSVEKRLALASSYWKEAEPNEVDGGNKNKAESFSTFVNRTSKVLEYFKNMEDGTHTVYSHGLWISMLIWQILGQATDSNKAMQQFRQFELSIRARNCEVFLLTFDYNNRPAITKVRTRTDNHYNAI